MFISTGTVIDGKYEVRRTIGSGGMGVVYEAYQQDIDRVVALKLLTAVDDDPEEYTRFLREAQVLNRLSHPNIVQFYAFGVWHGYPYIVMEKLTGKSLHELIVESETGIDPLLAVDIVLQICAALDSAHKQDIIHRDIKPSNVILVASAGRAEGDSQSESKSKLNVKLVDFGLAKMTGVEAHQKITKTGMVMGSVNYMSPEQCAGQVVDQRTDIYSLGCVLFECLIAELPFAADNAVAVMFQHLQEPITRASGWTRLTTGQQQVLAKCLAKGVKHRYQSAGELMLDLEDMRAGATPRSSPVNLDDASATPYALDENVFGAASGSSSALPAMARSRRTVLLMLALILVGLTMMIIMQTMHIDAGTGRSSSTSSDNSEKQETSILQQNRTLLSKLDQITDPRVALERGAFFRGRQDFPAQIAFYERANQLETQGRAANQPLLAFAIKRSLAIAYDENHQFDKATPLFLEALEIGKKTNTRTRVESLRMMGAHCRNLHQQQEALQYTMQSAKLAEQDLKDDFSGTVSERHFQCMGCWQDAAHFYELNGKWKQGLPYRWKAREHAFQAGDENNMLNTIQCLANSYCQLHDYKQAGKLMDEWLRLEATVTNDTTDEALLQQRCGGRELMGDIVRNTEGAAAAHPWYVSAVQLGRLRGAADGLHGDLAVALTRLAMNDYMRDDIKAGDADAAEAAKEWALLTDEEGNAAWAKQIKIRRDQALARASVSHK